MDDQRSQLYFLFFPQMIECSSRTRPFDQVGISVVAIDKKLEQRSARFIEVMKGPWARDYIMSVPGSKFFLTPTLAVISTQTNIHIYDFFPF